MKSAKIEMNKGLLEAVHENGLPVNIQTGREYNDCNGDRTVEVLMEYDESDKMLVMGALNATINEWAGLV